MPAPDELTQFAQRLEAIGSPYMITGATAAILYGQPRVTNDLDVVLSLDDAGRAALLRAFPEEDFYVPPESVIRTEPARAQRVHCNRCHLDAGVKADIYLTGSYPLLAWAVPRRRRVAWSRELSISVAPPEYVGRRKLEYYREGRSSKHVTDIQAIRAVTGLDDALLAPWLARAGLETLWRETTTS